MIRRHVLVGSLAVLAAGGYPRSGGGAFGGTDGRRPRLAPGQRTRRHQGRGAAAHGATAFLILFSSLFAANTGTIAAMVHAAGLPAIMLFPAIARCGGLVTHSHDLQDFFRRAAATARPLEHGERANDLPPERPNCFTLALTIATAETFGLDPPPLLLVRNVEVAE